MKLILLLIIKIYQVFVPHKFRTTCLFKESCSNYVFRSTMERGFLYGMHALFFRVKNCKPNYYLIKEEQYCFLVTANNEVVLEDEISELLLQRETYRLLKEDSILKFTNIYV